MKELYKQLQETINSLPGIEVSGSNLTKTFDDIKSGWNGLLIFFYSDEKDAEGLFFLTRCIDSRYWEFGHIWRIELSCGDQIHPNGDRPITYNIFRPINEESEEEIEREIESLIYNMHHHFHHDNFMTYYNMDRTKYDLKEWKRQMKLNDLGIDS
jgi:hypothetical protein